ncbi:glycyl-tRNA synthetase subunit beta [compost metagenome]
MAALEVHDASKAISLAAELTPAVTSFFDAVMVMAEDQDIRENRLALLASIHGDLKQFADFSKLVW